MSYLQKKAVLVTDMVGFGRRIRAHGPLKTKQHIHNLRWKIGPIIRRNGGRVVKYDGDDSFSVFDRIGDAYAAALELRDQLGPISIGIGYGKLLVLKRDAWGYELNLASKLGEDKAGPNDILLTVAAKKAMR